MDNTEFIKIPTERFERIMLTANLSETLSGKKVSHKEIMDLIAEENLVLSDEQQKEIDENYL